MSVIAFTVLYIVLLRFRISLRQSEAELGTLKELDE